MNTRLILLIYFLLVVTTRLFAQFSETIVSDRPGQTNSAYTVGKMVLQFQTGPQLDGSDHEDVNVSAFSFPAFIRFGITEKIELQTLCSYQSNRIKQGGSETKINGLSSADFGIRINIFEEMGNAPALGFEVLYKTKIRSSDYKPDHPSAKLNIMATKTLSDQFGLNANLGTEFDGNGGAPNGFYTLNLVYSISDALGIFFENYGNFSNSHFDTFFDFGGAYIVNPNFQLDLSGGFGYNNSTFSYLIAGGVSYRIVRWR